MAGHEWKFHTRFAQATKAQGEPDKHIRKRMNEANLMKGIRPGAFWEMKTNVALARFASARPGVDNLKKFNPSQELPARRRSHGGPALTAC